MPKLNVLLYHDFIANTCYKDKCSSYLLRKTMIGFLISDLKLILQVIIGQICLVVTRKINKREEIDFDYSMADLSDNDEFECRCMAPDCRKNIWERLANGFRSEKYAKYLPSCPESN